ncbi:DUF3847 domain-containing protein, partial [Dysosmobacter welbionis]
MVQADPLNPNRTRLLDLFNLGAGHWFSFTLHIALLFCGLQGLVARVPVQSAHHGVDFPRPFHIFPFLFFRLCRFRRQLRRRKKLIFLEKCAVKQLHFLF